MGAVRVSTPTDTLTTRGKLLEGRRGASSLLFGFLLLAACLWGLEETTPPPVDVGSRKQLLFDDALIASKMGFVTTLNPATRVGAPVIVLDKPWEKARLGTGQSVVEDDGIYKMWYTSTAERRNWYLCYATSKDGIHWVKPSLGIIEFQNSKENNIVFAGTSRTAYAGQSTVFRDPHGPSGARFKLVYGSNLRNPKEQTNLPKIMVRDYSEARWKESGSFISAAYSPDGLHWTPSERLRSIEWYYDTQDVAFWDDRIKKYVLFVRWNHETLDRAIGRSESDDFEDFPKPQLVLTSDALDPVITGLYNNAATKYPYADRAYFLFISAFYHSPGDVSGGPDGSEVQLATSRDGIHFLRPWRNAFLRIGLEGRFDASQVYMGPGVIRAGDELYLYYTGYRPSHHELEAPPPGSGGIGVAKIRLDGFASQDAPPTGGAQVAGGVLITVPLKFSGNHLELNVDAGAGGWLKVEILDQNGQPLPEYASQADLILGNSVRKTVTWQKRTDLSALQGRSVQLRFIGRDVKLYAFQFSN